MPPKRGGGRAAEQAPEPEEDYGSWSVPKLKARLQELGASASGSKQALVDRVKELTPVARGKAKAKAAPPPAAEPAPKRGAAKAAAKAEAAEPAPKRGAAKAAAKEEPPAKRARAAEAAPEAKPPEGRGKKRGGDAQQGDAQPSSSQPSAPAKCVKVKGPSEVYFEDGDFSAEYAKSGRSVCKRCMEKIEQGALRIGKSVPSDKFDGNVTNWHHLECFLQAGLLPRSTQIIKGFSTLRPEDQENILKVVPSEAGEGSGGKVDKEMKEQNKKVFEVLDALAELSEGQINEMLELNGYPTQKLGPAAATKWQLCADGICFGAVAKCQVCSTEEKTGHLLLSGEGYRCRGWINTFLACTFKTQTPERVKWELTPAAKGAAGGKLGKMKLTTGNRLFASELKDDEPGSASSAADAKKPPFLGLTFVVIVKGGAPSKKKLEDLIKSNGGSVANVVTRATTCVVANDKALEEETQKVEGAKEENVPGVGPEFVTGSVEAGELQDMEPHLLWGEARRQRTIQETKTSKFVEKGGVKMDTDVGDLAGKAHVLVDMAEGRVYSEMLNVTDVVTGVNSFYTLHLLESDSGQPKIEYWVFRKWGRIGVSQGGTKLEEWGGDKAKAIHSFCKWFLDKTGNAFGGTFEPRPGKMLRLDVEHKVLSKSFGKAGEGQPSGGGGGDEGADDQPLGKLSKAQIEKGDAVLDKVEVLLNDKKDDADSAAKAKTDAQFKSLSAEYYTLIPHDFGFKRPPIITTPDLLGAEKALLQFYLRMGFEDMSADKAVLTPIAGVMELPCPATLAEAASMCCDMANINSCNKKATGLQKKKAGNPHAPMTAAHYASILLYTANAIYQQLNKALRDEDRAKVKKYFPFLRLLFEACSRLPQKERTLWRGIGVNLYDQYQVGSTITWWGVSSCTSDEKVARNFMNGCGGGASFLTVETHTACEISDVSFYGNEAESILLPGTQLEVVASEKAGANKCKINLREVGRVVK